MDADPQKRDDAPLQPPSREGYVISPWLPDKIMEHVGFTYKPPEDPLQAAHNREMAKSKEQFRRTLVVILFSLTAFITSLVVTACAYIAIFDKDVELRKNAITALAGIIGTLFGAILGLNGAKLLGADEKKDKD